MREKRREEREEKRRERRYHRLRKKGSKRKKRVPPPRGRAIPRNRHPEQRKKKGAVRSRTKPRHRRFQGARREGESRARGGGAHTVGARGECKEKSEEEPTAKKNLCSSFSFLGSLPNCSLSHTLPALLLGPRSLFIGRENKEKRNKDSSNGLRSQGPRRRGRGRLRLGGARRREARIRRGGGAIFAFRALAGRLCRGPGLLDYLCRRRKDHFGPSRGRGAPGGGLGLDGEKGGGKEAGERDSELTFFCRGVVCLFQEKKMREPR